MTIFPMIRTLETLGTRFEAMDELEANRDPFSA